MNKVSREVSFIALLFGAFILEGAAYFAFPYVSLQLRDHFKFSANNMGLLLSVGIWFRPLWSILGGILGEKFRSIYLLVFGCLSESLAFVLLGIGSSQYLAIIAIIIANMGLSVWNPNLYAQVYRIYDNQKTDCQKKVFILNAFLYSGAAVGSMSGALVESKSRTGVFLGSGVLFLIALFVLSFLLIKAPIPIKPATREKFTKSWKDILLNQQAFSLIIVSVCFWASYNQFNAFFSLFANDWLKNGTMAGFAFGSVTLLVAFLSFIIPKSRIISRNIFLIAPFVLVLFSISWIMKVLIPNYFSVLFFISSIALAESFFVTILADLWAKIDPDKPHLMQSFNYSISTLGMGVGSLAGGYFYCSPEACKTLLSFGYENVSLLTLSLFCLIFFYRKRSLIPCNDVT
ncbi:MAG: MFS transporter [Oligoflexales bacterium]|nr:MFS transporter [Oligoflexales bacterium]